MAGTKITVSPNGGSTSTLTFTPTVEENGKFLSCRAENPYISGSAVEEGWTLEVHYLPQVSLQLGSSLRRGEIQEGNDVYLECNIHANPWVTEISWQFEGQELTTNTSVGIIVSNQSLVLQRVQVYNRGRYTCSAVNKEGMGVSTELFLRIRHAPVCKPTHQNTFGVAKNEAVRVPCELEADPTETTFHWRFNGTTKRNDVYSFSNNQSRSVVTYVPNSEDDYGVLLCWGTNSIGIQRQPCIFYIVPAGPPDAAQNCTVLNQTEDSVHIQCLEGYNGGLEQYFVLEIHDTDRRRLHSNLTAGEPNFLVQGLPGGTSFRVLVYAANGKGRSTAVMFPTSTLKPAEKLMVGVDSNFAFRPILGLLIGVVATLVIMAALLIIIMKLRSRQRASEKSRGLKDKKKGHMPLKKDVEDAESTEDKGPDIIPANSMGRGLIAGNEPCTAELIGGPYCAITDYGEDGDDKSLPLNSTMESCLSTDSGPQDPTGERFCAVRSLIIKQKLFSYQGDHQPSSPPMSSVHVHRTRNDTAASVALEESEEWQPPPQNLLGDRVRYMP